MLMPTSLPPTRVPDPMDAPPLRWGILATGGIARSFAGALKSHTRQVIQACGSRTQASADAFAAEFGGHPFGSYEALVSDPNVDAVYVASPHSHHAAHALLAITAGKHVLVEKSFTRTAAEASIIVDAARDAGVTLMEAMWTRFLPGMDVVRQLLANGALGEIETVMADHGQYFEADPNHRLFAPELAGGALLDLGIYPLSFSFFALGRPARIAATGTTAFTGVDRQVSMTLDGYAAAPHAQALLSTTLAARTPTTASICGTEARIELPGPFYIPQPVTLIGRDGVRLTSPQPTILAHEGLCYEAAHFAQLVADGRRESPWLPWSETIAIMEAMDAITALVAPQS